MVCGVNCLCNDEEWMEELVQEILRKCFEEVSEEGVELFWDYVFKIDLEVKGILVEDFGLFKKEKV